MKFLKINNGTPRTFNESLSIKDFGATGDGSTNDNAAITAALSFIGASNYRLSINYPIKFSGNLSFPSNVQLDFYNNGKLIGTTGSETVTVNGPLTAPAIQIFSTCSPSFTYGTTVFPEWFGALGDGSTDDYAAINKAVTSLASTRGVVLFSAKTYKMSSTVTISSSNLILRGSGNWATRIVTTGASQSAFQFTGVSSASKINHNGVEDMFIYKSVTATGGVGILLSHCAVATLKNLQISDFGIGVQLANATNTLVSNVVCSNSSGNFNFIGFYADGTDPNGNVSSKFENCSVDAAGNTGTSVGFYNVSTAAGGNINDVYFENCATASCYSGYKIDGSNQLSNAWGDIIINNPIVDYFTDYGILIANMPTGSQTTIQGGWIDPKPLGTDTISLYVYQSSGVIINGTQFFCDPTTARGTYGIKLYASSDTLISGCVLYDYKYGVYSDASSYCSVTSNKFYSANTFTTTHIGLTTTTSNFVVSDNLISGYGTNGILFDTLTTLNKSFNNIYNTSLLTNPLVDNNPTSNNQLSIGNAIATSPLTINRTTNGTNTSAITGTKLHTMSLDGVINGTLQDAFGTINQIIGRRAQGTSASPTTLVNTAIMLRLGGQGRDDTGYNSNTAAAIDLLAEGTWSTTSLPTGISFKTTASSSTTLTERVRINNSGQLGIGIAPSSLLHVYHATAAVSFLEGDSATESYVVRHSTDASSPDFLFRKTRGSRSSISAVTSSDTIGRMMFQVYGGTNYRTIAYIQANVETFTSDSDISSRLTFFTTPSGTTTASERMRLDPSGNLGIGKTPSTLLDVNGPVALKAPSTINSATYSLTSSDSSLIITTTNCTITLQAASSYPGRILYVKNISANSLVSASSNVVPLAGGAAGTSILSASAGKFAMLQSDGTNWIIMMSN